MHDLCRVVDMVKADQMPKLVQQDVSPRARLPKSLRILGLRVEE